MAKVALTNINSLGVAENLLWELFANIGEDGKNTGNQASAIKEAVALPGEIMPAVHQGMASGEGEELVTDFKESPTRISFSTTAFAEGNQDLVVEFTLNGRSLVPTSAQSIVNNVELEFESVEYVDGQPRTNANIEEKNSGKLGYTVSYPVAPVANDITGDAEFLLTAVNRTTKNTSFDSSGGSLITRDSTRNLTMKTDVILRDDGTYSGDFVMLNMTNKTKGSDKSTENVSLKIDSKQGISLDQTDTFSGAIDRFSFKKAYKSADWSGAFAYQSTETNEVTAAALGRFFKGETTVSDVAAALFAGNDVISAKGGNITLNGYGGNDQLRGGKGNDVFEFSTALDAQNNVDRIIGFKKAGTDRILLDSEIFTGYRGAEDFVIGAAALDAEDRIIFNKSTGALLYDADGNGAGAAVQFATLVGKVNLTAEDISLF